MSICVPPRSRSFYSSISLITFGYFLAYSIDGYYNALTTGASKQKQGLWYCKWHPTVHKECHDVLRGRLPHPTPPPESPGASDGNEAPIYRVDKQRWLFLGDSQMSRLFQVSNIETLLVEDPLKMSRVGCLGPVSCIEKRGYRCNLNDVYDLPYAEEWTPPRPKTFVGPTHFGAKNPYCNDGAGSFPAFLQCVPQINEQGDTDDDCGSSLKYRYGGYIPIEYAQDVEIQTPEFRTTQENVAAFIDRNWNTPNMVREWGRPICVLAAGNHDARIRGITTGHFLRNVRFLLNNFARVCEHMIWIGNTANAKDDNKYPQTKALMQQWDTAVRRMIEAEPTLLSVMSFIDVRRASLRWTHDDHIHLDKVWYEKLGNDLLIPLIW